VRAQRGRSERSERRSFLTAENPIGAIVFTYFNINYCRRYSIVVRGGGIGAYERTFIEKWNTKN